MSKTINTTFTEIRQQQCQMQHKGLLARRKNYKNKICKKYFFCKTIHTMNYFRVLQHRWESRTRAGSTTRTHTDVVYLKKKYKNASLYLHTQACQSYRVLLLEHSS